MCKRIFGKDVAPLLGESKLKTQYELYTEIVKKLKKANSTKKYMAGRLLKPVILQMYLENTLYKEVKADVIQLAEEDWLWARADAVVENEEGVQIVVRCLNTTSWFRGTWDAEEYGMPIDYYYEAQVNMYALNCRCADIAVLKDGYDFEIIRLKYEPNIIKVLGNAYMKFLEHIEDEVEPKLVNLSDVNNRYADCSSISEIIVNESILNNIILYKSVKKTIKDTEVIKEKIEFDIKQEMGDAAEIKNAEGEVLVSWKKAKDYYLLDTDRLKRQRPDIYEEFKVKKEGNRRFLVRGE